MAEDLELDAGADVDTWCRRVDELVEAGTDPFVAIVDADVETRQALQLSLDRD